MKKIKKKALLLGLALSVLTACGKQGKKSETEVQGTRKREQRKRQRKSRRNK